MEITLILLIAVILDLSFGEPSNTWHPVAWLGKVISLEMRCAPNASRWKQIIFGTATCLITVAAATAAAYFLVFYLKAWSSLFYIVFASVLLKFTFALRGLKEATTTVKKSLAQDDLEQARLSIKALVSRNTSTLNRSQLTSAAVESAAENICDSFVAPLFYFLLFGLPGAVAYRVINTFDAMIGYRGQWEYLGKFAANLDDVANFVPARISSLLIVLAAWICRKNVSQAWHIMLRDHRKTESPNAGWTMSAIAGALGVQLEKTGHYQVGDNQQALSLETIDASLKVVMLAAAIWALLAILVEVIYIAVT